VTYDYNKKYLLGLSLRRDESSKFSSENRVGYFPGASVGWIASEENFLQSSDVINTLKIRASIGQTGNNNVGRYAYGGIYSVGYNYLGMAGTLPSEMSNPTLRWETTTQFNVGLDLGLLTGDRIGILFDFFNKTTEDLIFTVPLPDESGYNNIDQNIGKVRIWGYETELRAKIIDKGRFRWDADFNIGYFMNEVLELPDNGMDKNRIGGIYDPETGIGVGGIAVGERMHGILGYVTDYIIDNQEQADNALWDAKATGFSPVDGKRVKGRKIPGDQEWVDVNGDGEIDDYDRIVHGYSMPTTVGGFTNSFTYGNFSLNVFFDYALGHSITDATIRRSYGNVNNGMYNVMRESVTDTWTQDGDATLGNATMPRFDHQDQKHQKNYMRDSNKSIYKGDYLCFRELKFTYQAPQAVTSFLRLQSLRLSISGQNLYYFQSYPGWVTESADPNSTYNDDATYPVPRKIMFGIQIGL
jgi:TonB-linked SusC/RagA family outer membrane protein